MSEDQLPQHPVESPVELPWQRLDPRMLLVHPFREVGRFLPVLVGLFIAGTATGGIKPEWQALGILAPIVLGLLRYLTTSFRVMPDRVELRRGLLDRHLLSTRRDRVRSVDLTSSPIERVLGLTTVRIGTGTASTSGDDQIDLDGLPIEQARMLRADLLIAEAPTDPEDPDAPVTTPARPTLVLDPSWARYAPMTAAGLALAGAVVGIGSQVVETLGAPDGWFGKPDPAELAGLVVLPLLLVVGAVMIAVLAVAGYLVTNWGFTLTHDRGSWHLRRGLLTTRETSVDDERVAGVVLGEPIGLRAVGAARLNAIVTGLDRSTEGSSVLVPPAPRPVVDGVAGEVIGSAAPLTGTLRTHGPAAVRRRWTRALVPALVVAGALVTTAVLAGGAWLVFLAVLAPVAAAGLARDRARGLGHDLTDGFLVARSGSLLRQRHALDVDDVIGWNFRSTWFQRRVGLTTLVATTAGGPQSVTVLDVGESRAVEVAATAQPGLVDQFTR